MKPLSSTAQRRNRRERLWHEDPHCRFCGCLTVLEDHSKGSPKDNYATIEHLRSRLNPSRYEKRTSKEDVRTTLCCWRCNNDRNKSEQANLVEIQKQRSMAGKPNARKIPEWVADLKRGLAAAGWPEKGKKPGLVRFAQERFIKKQITFDDFVAQLIRLKKHYEYVADRIRNGKTYKMNRIARKNGERERILQNTSQGDGAVLQAIEGHEGHERVQEGQSIQQETISQDDADLQG